VVEGERQDMLAVLDKIKAERDRTTLKSDHIYRHVDISDKMFVDKNRCIKKLVYQVLNA
jgi:hypothetical protein